MLKILVAAGLLALPAAAEAAPASISPGDVFSAVVGEWNNDGTPDHAVLVRNGPDALDLYIYTSDPTPDDRLNMKLAVYVPGFASVSADMDNTLELESKTYNSLQYSEYYMKGGYETLTLSYRGGQFVVSGVTFISYDNLNDTVFSCDVNLLTGKGIVDKKPVKVAVGGVPVAEWNLETDLKICPR